MARLRNRLQQDSGASLILVMALVMFLGTTVGAMLSYSAASLGLTSGTFSRVQSGNDAGGALNTAINNVRNNVYDNNAGETCPALTYPGTTGSVPVTCVPGPNTGGTHAAVPINTNNYPTRAITTLSTSASEIGLDSNPPNNSTTSVQGGIWSNTNIAVAGQTTLAQQNGKVEARGSCTVNGTLTSAPDPPDCNKGGTALADPAIAKPASYAQIGTSGLTRQAVPTCTGVGSTGSTIKFSPGLYDDAAALTSIFKFCAKVFWFQPGNYYFDFRDVGDHIWEIKQSVGTGSKSVVVIGGTPSGWDPNAETYTRPPYPGGCVSPMAAQNNNGVEFIFGGDSQLKLSQVDMELCGTYSSSRLPFVFYGAKNTIPTAGQTVKMGSSNAVSSGDVPFRPLTPAALQTIEPSPTSAEYSTANLKGNRRAETGIVAIPGYVPGTAIPQYSYLKTATLRVSHREVRSGANVLSTNPAVTIAPTAGGVAESDISVPTNYVATGGAFRTDSIDVTAQVADGIYDNGWTGASIKYSAAVAPDTTVTVDLNGIELDLDWATTSVRPQSGCVNIVPPMPGSCVVLDAKQNHGALYAQGTVYLPLNAVDYTSDALVAPQFLVGIIVRRLFMNAQPQNGYTGPIVQLPLIQNYVDLVVYFTATCSGTTCGTAKVTYNDPLGAAVVGSRNVTVNSWNVVPR